MVKTTVSVIKADVGSIAGHTCPTQEMLEYARKKLSEARDSRIIRSYYVYSVGDDIGLVMTHDKGEDNAQVHELAWNVFKEVTEKVSKPLKLYAAGQDLLKDAFSGTVKGMGPGVAELEFEERGSDPIVVFAADKTSPAAWNLILYRIFADPFNTAGLVIDPILHDGFIFEVMDLRDGRIVRLKTPEETYDLLSLIGTINRYVISRVYRARDNEPAASASTTRLSYIAGKYVGKDDPVLIVRAQSGFPAIGEILSAFAIPHLVPGWMRGSHYGPLMPVSFKKKQNIISYFDGPPRVIAMGWQVSDGMLVGVEGNEPVDLFEDPVWDYSRELATKIAFYMRSMGEVMPARVELEEMEYTTLPKVLEKLKERFITTLK
ncbi:MAG: fructose-1,6-bisphosphatase [Thaumarchaeota archaeon]|jgi:fructose 1,6-bisphosphate aldolase/phosphatase|nr:fructose-1,6-bisphosphatase [Candidatus Geocrenenecus arthurdayi]